MTDDLNFEVTGAPDPQDLAYLGTKLANYNNAAVGPSGRCPLAVFVRDGTGAIVAGLSGYTAWGWLYVQWLWVDEGRRGKGLAGQMLERAEAEARTRGCHGSYIDTFNPDALKAYRKAGYVVFGVLEDFPRGHCRTFLRKVLGG